jgi:hypothetical protein
LYQPQSFLQANDNNDAIFGLVILLLVQVDASDPQARDRFEVGFGTELGQGVDGEGVVAQDAGLVDLGEDEDLLYSRSVGVVVGWLQPRGDNGSRVFRGITGLRREQDEVEDFSG